ncbi:hypothetical protein DVH24_038050 [Malus domestica]|uniref:Uncharacterized protein n=1 Tax=Malus domestica TaxID=3750 RepID=A0A498K8S1_MALDO|nr:hypothetical protein DVH24_038050 [Malus domestica]
MQHWKQWLPFQHDRGRDVFPCLKRSIKECYKLEGKLPENLKLLENCAKRVTKVKDLKINGCEELTSSLKMRLDYCSS